MSRSIAVSGRLMRPLLFTPFLALGLAVPAAVAETDGACAHPASAFRHAWCSVSVQQLEQELERVQRHVVSGLQGPDKRMVMSAQSEWSRSLDRRCPSRGDAETARSCLVDAYQTRLSELKAIGVGAATAASAIPAPLPPVAPAEPAPAKPVAEAAPAAPVKAEPAKPAAQLAMASIPPARVKPTPEPKATPDAAPAADAAPKPADPAAKPTADVKPAPKQKLSKREKAEMAAATAKMAVYSPEQANDMDKVARGENAVAWMARFGGIAVTHDVLRKEGWNYCALTIDDGPHPVWTPKVLEVLRQEKVPVTYFVVGKAASVHPEIIQAFAAEGHEIGNHSWSHPDLRKMSADEQRNEIEKTSNLLRSLGITPKVFRPPFGAYNADTVAYMKESGLDLSMWSVDSRDWSSRNSEAITIKVRQQLTPAPIVLLHATLPATVEALPGVIAEMRARGCRFVTMSQWFTFIRTPPAKPSPVIAASAAPTPAPAPSSDAAAPVAPAAAPMAAPPAVVEQ